MRGNVLQTKDYSLLEPQRTRTSFYAPGVGPARGDLDNRAPARDIQLYTIEHGRV